MYLLEDASGSLRFPLVAKDKEKGRINVLLSFLPHSFYERRPQENRKYSGWILLSRFLSRIRLLELGGMEWKKGSELFCEE